MPAYNISANELFERVSYIITLNDDISHISINKMMHETLVLTCHEGIKNTNQAFGNLFSQVDFLCKVNNISASDKIAIQDMRRHSNKSTALSHDDILYDARAMCLLISAVFKESIPSFLIGKIPTENRPYSKRNTINARYIRGIVKQWDGEFITLTIEQDSEDEYLKVDYSAEDMKYIDDILRVGMQLNLLDCHLENGIAVPKLIVVEPDFMIDISSIAACFQDYGHHPLLYTINRMKPRVNTQATLLGNFAGSALDDIINQDDYHVNETIKNNFKEKALEFCTCTKFDGNKFIFDANTQSNNLKQVVVELFKTYDKDKAILEPSFVCEKLGIRGRVDLMTSDCKLLVEQKSGRNLNIENGHPNEFGSFQLEPHYVQLLLYYGILKYNFNLGNNAVDIRLLYSKYPPAGGLVVVAFYQRLFRESIRFRNELVAEELEIADNGFESVIDDINPETLNIKKMDNMFYHNYLYPEIDAITSPLQHMSKLERAYYCTMMTFVYREQRVAKVGSQEGVNNCNADIWNMPLSEKKETGNIYTGLNIIRKERSSDFNGYDLITLAVPDQGEDFLPNFRTGDMVYLYSYRENEEPDARKNILYKGIIKDMCTDQLTVYLNDGQQNQNVIESCMYNIDGKHSAVFAIEHGGSDSSTSGAVRSLHDFMTAESGRKDLLMAQREPRQDKSLQLSRSYNENYNEILLKAKQAMDYFLLIGPPGTGKTSMAIRFLVEEELTDSNSSILLTAYTNRAVDEICSMLNDAGCDFLRIGNEYSCDPRFRNNLIDKAIDDCPKLSNIRSKIINSRIIVGTTSMLVSKPYIFNIKRFSLAIVDEASQILEPNIIGILSAHYNENIDRQTVLRNCIRKFILVGDYKQLPAVVQQSEKDSAVSDPLLKEIHITDCRNSLFERLIRTEDSAGRQDFVGILHKQGRMHPDIAEFPNKMFYFRERLEPVPCPHQTETELHYDLPAQDEMDRILQHNRMIFIPSDFCKTPDISEKVNQDEAHIVTDTLQRIHRFYGEKFDPIKSVGVIVPYRNQIAMIRKEIEKLGIPELLDISIDTVERYQGSQRDVIIYSFTIQNYYQLDFLTGNSFVEDGHIIDRKLNVAITRARKQMIITGNPKILSGNAIFKSLIEFIETKMKI